MDSGDVSVGDAECAERGDMWRAMPERAHDADPAKRHRQDFRENRSELCTIVVRHDDICPVAQGR
jgi:hypothetical protein